MELLRDYLGSNYAIIVSYGLLMLWFVALGFIQKKAKQKKTKPFKRSWWFWTINILLIVNIFFTQFNKSWFGISTPDHFVELIIEDDEIILFDNEITYYDDDNTSTDDYSSHLRIHVVDRKTHEKKYEDLIGTNYGYFIDQNEIFILEYTGYSKGYLKEVFTYNTDTQEMVSVVEQGESINCDGKNIEAYEIEVVLGIIVTSPKGKQYIYDSSSKNFKEFTGEYLNRDSDSYTFNHAPFQLIAEQNSTNRTFLTIDQTKTRHTFISGEIVKDFKTRNQSYVFIKSYEDLKEETILYSFIDSSANNMWQFYLDEMEEKVDGSGFEEVQQIKLKDEFIYMTINAYLFELSLQTGTVNWWLKL